MRAVLRVAFLVLASSTKEPSDRSGCARVGALAFALESLGGRAQEEIGGPEGFGCARTRGTHDGDSVLVDVVPVD